MLKLAGCVLILASCCSLGFLKASSYQMRSKELADILEIIKLLDMEITYRKDTLAKSFEKISSLKTCWFSKVLQRCSVMLAEQYSLQDAWQNAMQENEKESPLVKQDIEILGDLALGLGRSDSQGQSRLFEPALLRLDLQMQQARDEQKRQGRMYQGLGTAVGVVIVLLIL